MRTGHLSNIGGMLLAGFSMLAAWTWTRPCHADMVDLGRGWKATFPAGYGVAQDGADQTIGTTLAQPLKQIVTNWTTLDPVSISFVNNSKSSDAPQPLDQFFLRMEFTNKTGQAWGGLQFAIIDNNGTQGGGSLLHPFQAHFHTDFFDPATVGFTTFTSTPNYGNDYADNNRGVYQFSFTGGFAVNPNDTWKPKLLDFHDRLKFDGEQNITAFTIVERPITPLPSSAVMGLALAIGAAMISAARLRHASTTNTR